MIINGGSRAGGAFFARHLMRGDENERVSVVEIRGLAAGNVREALREMEAVASGTACTNYFYHANMNTREDERLTPEQWEQAADTLEHELGLSGQPRFIVEHEKEGRIHRHVVWSRIDADSMTAVSDSLTYRRHEAAARAIEREFGLAPVESVLVKDRGTARPERREKDWESFRGADSGIDPQAVKAEITALWQGADSGQSFQAALEEAGYILAKGDRRDFCVIDQAGDEHSLARRISGEKAAGIRSRMADVDREALPSVAEAREMARAEPDSGGGNATPRPPQAEPSAAPGQDSSTGLAAWTAAPAGTPEGWQAAPASTPPEAAPAPQGVGQDWQAARPGQGGDQREQFTLWERFAARMQAIKDRAAAWWHDEEEPDAEGGKWARLARAAGKVVTGWRHHDGRDVAESVAEAVEALEEGPRKPPEFPTDQPGSFKQALKDAIAQGPRSPAEQAAATRHYNAGEDGGGGDDARPGGDAQPPEPRNPPQERQEPRTPLSALDRIALEWAAAGMGEGEEWAAAEPEQERDAEPDGPDGPDREPEGWDIEP